MEPEHPLVPAQFVVYVHNDDTGAAARRLVIDRTPSITTIEQARDYLTEILSGAWKVAEVISIEEPAEFVAVLDALDQITEAAAAPVTAPIPARACPGGARCECHHEGI
jgi:hypothetical protein